MRALPVFLPFFFLLYRLLETEWHPYYFSLTLIYLIPAAIFLTKKNKKYISFWAGSMIGYCLLDHIFRGVSFPDMKEQATGLDYWYIFPSVLLILLGHVAQTFRWSTLLENVQRLSFFDLFPSMMIGYLVNNLLPAKTGEVVKAYHLGRSKNISKISILATVFVEKVLDGLTILLFLFIPLLLLKEGGGKISSLSLAVGSLYIGGLFFLLALFFFKVKINGVCQRYLNERAFRLVSKGTESFSKGLSIFESPKQVASAVGTSFLMWTCTALSLWPVLWMFDFEVPFFTPFFILSFICFGQTLPAAPAGIGIINFASVLSLEIIFKNKGVSVSETLYTQIAIFSLIVNAVMVIPEIVLGLYFALTTDMGFSTLIKKSDTET
ncbi:MAG: lysylphosphatidylglycerol synthase transmembrane domain-containing protein [Nitrospinota bacterium]